MTRIFDALRKADAARQHGGHVAAPVTPLPTPHTAAGARPAAVGHAHGGEAWFPPLPLAGAAGLDGTAAREMTTLRVHIEAALPERSPRIVLFLGPQGGEGASTIALQFVQMLARDPGVRPLLVDAHATRPAMSYDAQHRAAVLDPALAVAGSEGVMTANLFAMPLPESAQRAGLIAPQALRQAIDSASPGYDWVVVDGPPVLEAPDAAPLAALVDGVVLVLQAGRSKRPVVARTVEVLRKAGAHLLGSVLNRRVHEIPEFIYRRI